MEIDIPENTEEIMEEEETTKVEESIDVAKMQAQNEILQQQNTQMQAMLERLQSQVQTQAQSEKTAEPELKFDKISVPENMDELSNEEVINYIAKSVLENVHGMINPITEKLTTLESTQTEKEYEAQVKDALRTYKDFPVYAPSAAKVAERVGGNLTAEEAYILAKHQKGGFTQKQATEKTKKKAPVQSEKPGSGAQPVKTKKFSRAEAILEATKRLGM